MSHRTTDGSEERALPPVETIAFAMEIDMLVKKAESRLAKNGKGQSAEETAKIIFARAQIEAQAQAGGALPSDWESELPADLPIEIVSEPVITSPALDASGPDPFLEQGEDVPPPPHVRSTSAKAGVFDFLDDGAGAT